MNDQLIASDAPLTAEQQAVLTALADTIVPPSEDGLMPGAGTLDFLGYLQRAAEDFLPELPEILDAFDPAFATEDLALRYERVKAWSEAAPEAFQALLGHVYGCYYQDGGVLETIGVGAGPPFPRGNTVEPGDLSLLDPVMQSSTQWRRDVPG